MGLNELEPFVFGFLRPRIGETVWSLCFPAPEGATIATPVAAASPVVAASPDYASSPSSSSSSSSLASSPRGGGGNSNTGNSTGNSNPSELCRRHPLGKSSLGAAGLAIPLRTLMHCLESTVKQRRQLGNVRRNMETLEVVIRSAFLAWVEQKKEE